MKKYKFEEKHYFNINHTKIKILHRFRFRIINENKKIGNFCRVGQILPRYGRRYSTIKSKKASLIWLITQLFYDNMKVMVTPNKNNIVHINYLKVPFSFQPFRMASTGMVISKI